MPDNENQQKNGAKNKPAIRSLAPQITIDEMRIPDVAHHQQAAEKNEQGEHYQTDAGKFIETVLH